MHPITYDAPTTSVLQAKQVWRAAAYAVGAHLKVCEICKPQIGSVVVRNACAEYIRLDAAEGVAWAAYERARSLEAGHGH